VAAILDERTAPFDYFAVVSACTNCRVDETVLATDGVRRSSSVWLVHRDTPAKPPENACTASTGQKGRGDERGGAVGEA
jgi:hypothetical protein